MGKGFNNYMTKKFFHPSSKENIKRVWMAQQKTDFEKKKEDEMLNQYQKEQDMYENRALLGDEKAKLGLSFMYDAPPGLQKKEKEDPGEAEVKFEWQRKYNAPREQYAKNDETILDQPFGIEVRNVRCIKCRKWGHVNTDRICPLFGKDLTAEPEQPKSSASNLLESMREDGFTLKQSLLGKMTDPSAPNEKMLPSDEEDDPEVQFLKSLTLKQKKKLFKKLNKLQEGDGAGKVEKKKKKKKRSHKHGKQKKKKQESSADDSESSDEEVSKHKKSKKGRKSKDSSDVETSSSEDDHKIRVRKNGGIGQKGRKSYEPTIKKEAERYDYKEATKSERDLHRDTSRNGNHHRDNDDYVGREIKMEREEHSERHHDSGRGGDSYRNREIKREIETPRESYRDRRNNSNGRDHIVRNRSPSAERYSRDRKNRDRKRSNSRDLYRSRSRSTDRKGQRSRGRKRSDSSPDDKEGRYERRAQNGLSSRNGKDADRKRLSRKDNSSSEDSESSDEGHQRSRSGKHNRPSPNRQREKRRKRHSSSSSS